MANKSPNQIYLEVKNRYSSLAQENCACCTESNSCCGSQIYDKQSQSLIPDGANLGLGCGNPFAITSLKPGEIVVDLGSGAGVDVFIAAEKVGKSGKVIGVDMTPEMIHKARLNQQKGDYPQVEFRLGEIEHLPVENESVDIIISNCVVNLSPNKKQVFSEAMRVLRPGGRLAISDMVRITEIPMQISEDPKYYTACISGAIEIDEIKDILSEIGFEDIAIYPIGFNIEHIDKWIAGVRIEAGEFRLSDYVRSASISARKPI